MPDGRLDPELTFGHRHAASPLSLPPSLASSTFLLASSTLPDQTLSAPSPVDPSVSISITAADWAKIVSTLAAEGAAVKEVEFLLKGAEP